MEKKDFVSLVLGTIGIMLFALGMCMCLLPEWQAFDQGIGLGAAGLVVLTVMLLVRRRMMHKPPIRFTAKTIGTVALGIAGVLTLGVGMCLTMVWPAYLVWGVVVGCVGIVLLLSLIPVCIGLK